MSEWISVEDELPDHKTVCLTVWHGVVQNVLYRLYNRTMWHDENDEHDGAGVDEFSHWMPRPEPPK